MPEGWEWCRFGSVVTLMSGTTYPAEKELLSGTHLYVKVGDMNLPGNEYEISTSSHYLDEYNISHLIPVNSVIFPKRGGAIATNKKKLVLRDEILIDLNTMAFTPISPVNLMYCYYWFLSIDLGKINSGSSVPQINNKDIEPLLFPVPPTFEQERIVQAIVPLLDAEQKISAAGIEVAQIISRAKSKILDLAIRGKLVPQDPNDEPASVLLERIRAEKEELIKQGKIKRDKKESIIFRGDDNSYYFDIPNNWIVCYLKEIFNVCSAKRVKQSEWKTSGVPFYRAREIVKLSNNGYIDNDLFISEEHYMKLKAEFGVPKSGDLMVSGVGTIGRVYIVKENDLFYYKDASVLCFENRTGAIDSQFARYMFESKFMQSQMKENSNGTTVDTITISAAMDYVCVLPPIAEQKRIVTAIEKAFSQLDKISESIA